MIYLYFAIIVVVSYFIGSVNFARILAWKKRKQDIADKIAENIRKRFSELDFEDCPHQTISLGTAEALENETSDSLCSRVDHALYDAKNSGRNRVCSAKDIQ